LAVYKPFHYTIYNNLLVKKINVHRDYNNSYKRLLLNMEIIKRLYSIDILYKLKQVYWDGKTVNNKYLINDKNIKRFKLKYKYTDKDYVIKTLHKMIGFNIKEEDLKDIIVKYSKYNSIDAALRIFENRPFSNKWKENYFYPEKPILENHKWKLFSAIVNNMANIINKNNSEFAILSDVDIGKYKWSTYWGLINNSDESKNNYLGMNELIKNIVNQRGGRLIENNIEVKRARNDSHPNIEGNNAMANNIYEFLMINYLTKIKSSTSATNENHESTQNN